MRLLMARNIPTSPAAQRAREMLIEEFLDALAIGPSAHVPTPDTCRVAEAPLSVIVRMLMSCWLPATWDAFTRTFSEPEGEPAAFLAAAYADWVVDCYAAMGAFDSPAKETA